VTGIGVAVHRIRSMPGWTSASTAPARPATGTWYARLAATKGR